MDRLAELFERLKALVAIPATSGFEQEIVMGDVGSIVHFETSSGQPLTVLKAMVGAAETEAQVAEW